MNGIIYCRVSSKEQIEGTSLESQRASCLEYARSKGIEILRVFVEQGESAKFADRTQLLELIDFCRTHKNVNVLLVWKVDRFARNVADHFSVKATLGKYGVRIVSVTEPIDTNPEGKLMETILAGFAEFDNGVRTARTIQGMRRKLQDGIFPWGPPLGYRSSVQSDEKKTQPDLPDEATFSMLQKAWREFATGAHTTTEIGRLMQSWGLAPARGGTFAPQSLHQLFTNPYYAGILVDPWTKEEHIGKHVPMVTPDEFARVQQIIARRNRSVPHQKDRREFPLRGLVRCDACLRALTGSFSRGRNSHYPYYLCQRHECSRKGKSHRAGEVHGEFDSFLDEVAPRAQLIRKIGERVLAQVVREEGEHSDQRQRRQKRQAQLDAENHELIKMRAQNLITDQEFMLQKQRLFDQRMALENSSKMTFNIDQVRTDLDQIVKPLAALRETWHSLRAPFRRRFERLILPGGFVIGKIRTADLGLLFSLFRASMTADSSGVPLGCVPSNHIISEIHEFSEVICGVARIDKELPIAV